MDIKKKRRSKINRNEYIDLFPIDFEDIVEKGDKNLLTKIAISIYDFYIENIIGFTPTKESFTNLFLSYTRTYRKEDEINYYYFIKYALELHYKMHNHRRYFSEKEEHAFREYIFAKTERRKEIIYNKFLYYPLTKLVENIINTYKLRLEKMSYEDQHVATMAYVHEKINKFKPTLEKKAYSYFGTIIKRYLINERKKEAKTIKLEDSFDALRSHLIDDVQYSYIERLEEENINNDFFNELLTIMEYYINDPLKVDFLSDKDITVGQGILQIMKDWENIFDGENSITITNRFQKKYVFNVLRNYTGMSTPEISCSLKVFKGAYKKWKADYINSIYNPFDNFN